MENDNQETKVVKKGRPIKIDGLRRGFKLDFRCNEQERDAIKKLIHETGLSMPELILDSEKGRIDKLLKRRRMPVEVLAIASSLRRMGSVFAYYINRVDEHDLIRTNWDMASRLVRRLVTLLTLDSFQLLGLPTLRDHLVKVVMSSQGINSIILRIKEDLEEGREVNKGQLAGLINLNEANHKRGKEQLQKFDEYYELNQRLYDMEVLTTDKNNMSQDMNKTLDKLVKEIIELKSKVILP